MVLTLDKIVKEVAGNVGDRNGERLPEITRYVEAVVVELTMLFRQNSVYQTASIPVVNGKATLPNDVYTVLHVYDPNSTYYQVVDSTEWSYRKSRNTTLPTAQVLENVPNWTIELLNFASNNSTINVDYLIFSKDPAIIPTYYKDLIVLGAEAKYHRRRSTLEKAQAFQQDYKDAKNVFKEQQMYNQGRRRTIKGLDEIEGTDPGNNFLIQTQNGYINIGGMY